MEMERSRQDPVPTGLVRRQRNRQGLDKARGPQCGAQPGLGPCTASQLPEQECKSERVTRQSQGEVSGEKEADVSMCKVQGGHMEGLWMDTA